MDSDLNKNIGGFSQKKSTGRWICLPLFTFSSRKSPRQPFKDIRAKIFYSIDFFNLFAAVSDNALLVSEMKKKLGSPTSFPKIKRVENYPDFEKFAHVIQHDLQGLLLKISKMSKLRLKILVTFCKSLSVA